MNTFYFESFENDLFISDEKIYLGGLADPNKGYNWDISRNHQAFEKSLKLTVHENDHPQNANFPRSRAEITLNLNNDNHKTYYYSFNIFIPNNEEFADDQMAGYHIISQILNTTYQNGKPINVVNRKILGMQYYHNNTLLDTEARKLGLILYNSNFTNRKYGRIDINNALKKGVWNEFIFRIHWSENEYSQNSNEDFGSLQIWINRNPIVANLIKTHNYKVDDYHETTKYNCVIGSLDDIPTTFNFPNMSFTDDNISQPVQNILKLGHYRNKHTLNHSLYIDDIRITKDFPPSINKQEEIF